MASHRPSDDLVERCRDVLAWKNSGLLPDGALRRFAARLTYIDQEHVRLSVAESKTATEAMEHILFITQTGSAKP